MAGPWAAADVNAAGTRPGIYINFLEQAEAAVSPGSRGVVGIISEADWGPHNEIVECAALGDLEDAYTDLEDATARLYNLGRFAFLGGALTVKACRVMNTTNAVKATKNIKDNSAVDVISITAKYYGTRGNSITYDVGPDPIDSAKGRIRIYVDELLVHSVTSTIDDGSAGFIDDVVSLFAALDSEWVVVAKVATGDDDLVAVGTATALVGGANGDAVTSTQFTTCLALFASDKVHILTSDTVTGAIHTTIAAWLADQRETGYRVMGVLGSDTGDAISTIITDAQAFNTEAIVYVGPGAVTPNVAGVSTTYNGASIASLVAGLIAGLDVDRSLTGKRLPDVTSVETNATVAQVKSMLAAGVLTLTPTPFGSTPGVKVERGLTTLYNPGDGDIASFKLIRTLRIADAIDEGLTTAAQENFIGVQLNDAQGQGTVLDAIKDFLRTQAEARNIAPTYTVEIDESADNTDGNLFILISIAPIDAIEFIFLTISL